MARYMLDMDTCSYIMKCSNQTVVERLRAVPVTDVCMSIITKSELLYGVAVSPRREQDATALQAFLPHVEVLEFPDAAATHYAEIRADLKKRGQMIGANDSLLPLTHARSDSGSSRTTRRGRPSTVLRRDAACGAPDDQDPPRTRFHRPGTGQGALDALRLTRAQLPELE